MLSTLRGTRPFILRPRRFAVGIQAQRPATLTTPTVPTSALAIPPSSPLPRPTLRVIALQTPFYKTCRTRLSTKPPLQPNKIDREFEKEVAQRKLESRPEEVSSSSTVRSFLEESQAPPDDEQDVLAGVKSDLHTVKETLALTSVPREAYALGLAGTLPYLATSLSTVYLSYNLNKEWPTSSNFINSFLLNHESAAHWLQILEPIQVGYGAVIVSFLGAIHWGLEFGEKQPAHDRTRFRYGIGVLAPATAWPTIFMPIEWALITQFAAFCALYSADSRATANGWVPPWYGTYRFVLTAVVGVAIVVSLVGRAKIGAGHPRLTTEDLKDRLGLDHPPGETYRHWAKEEEKEKKKIKEEKKREEERRKQAEQKAKEEEEKKKQVKEGKKDAGEKDKSGDKDGESEEKTEQNQE